MNKSTEQFVFERFKELYLDFPVGQHFYQDSPDVIFNTTSGEIIGIEITEAIYDESEMEKSEYQIKINEMALKQLESKLPFKFDLSINLKRDNNNITQSNLKAIINEIVEICSIEFATLENHQVETIDNFDADINSYPPSVQQTILSHGYRNLPECVKYIRVGRYDVLDKSFHPQFKGGVVPNFDDALLAKILAKKHKAFEKYTVCAQQWLVIWEGGDFYSYFHNINIVDVPESIFDKIFMVRASQRLVVVLKA